jgi:hypothetical protein
LNFDKTFAPVARLELIHLLLAYATHDGFMLYQMDVKSAFLNGPIKEEVYVEQPPSFKSEEYPNHVYKLHKALYELKQSPKAWYECLRDFFIENGFRIGKADSTLSGSISPKVFSRFSFNFFDLLLIFVNIRSPYLGAPLGCRNLALNQVETNFRPCLFEDKV